MHTPSNLTNTAANKKYVGFDVRHRVPIPRIRPRLLDGNLDPLTQRLVLHQLEQVKIIIDHATLGLRASEYDHLQIVDGSGSVGRARRWKVLCGIGVHEGPFLLFAVEGEDVVGYLVAGVGDRAAEENGAEGRDD